jgi:glucose-1-phosphate adenylyltransferase
MARSKVLGLVLAGGEGRRLMPLTHDRAKPAVPFGGTYRLIDFALSNLVNAGFLKIAVLTQYKSHSLDRHITTTWRMSQMLGNYVTCVPAQQRLGKRWFLGSADAILQNFNLITDERPEHVIVFGADHVYRMDPRQMLEQHIATGADATVAGIRVPKAEASQFGIIETGDDGKKISQFLEKPEGDSVKSVPDDPNQVFASMGNYVFRTDALVEMLRSDAEDEDSKHDMGGNIIPNFVTAGGAYVYDFAANVVPGATERDRSYWRDVGSIDAYHDAHMDLVAVHPIFNLYNLDWPILTHMAPRPPAKFVSEWSSVGTAEDSIVAPGAIVAGARVRQSVISPDVRLYGGAEVAGSVILNRVQVGRGAVVRNAIIDKNVVIPDGFHVGVDRDADSKRFHVSAGGITVIGKDTVITP